METKFIALFSIFTLTATSVFALEKEEKALPGLSNTQTPIVVAQNSSTQMISQQRVRVKKLKRDIDSSISAMDQAGTKPFQDPKYIQQRKNRLQNFQVQLGKYNQFSNDPDVVAAHNSLARYEKMLAFGIDFANKQKGNMGDPQQTLAGIEKGIQTLQIPAVPERPLKQGHVEPWLRSLATVRNTAVTLYKPIPTIKQSAHLPNTPGTVQQGAPYDKNDVLRLERALQSKVSKIDGSLKQFSMDLNLSKEHLTRDVARYGDFNPADRTHQQNHFLGEGKADAIRAEIAKARTHFSESITFSTLLKRADVKDYQQALVMVKQTEAKFEENYTKALGLVRMPEAQSDDDDLLEIAEEILEKESAGKIRRMVITKDKVNRSRKTSEIEITDADLSLDGTVTLKGNETTYTYEWDEFQVATAETSGGKTYIHYTKLRNFSSGGPKTPIDRWIIGNRFKASEIPEKNIELD